MSRSSVRPLAVVQLVQSASKASRSPSGDQLGWPAPRAVTMRTAELPTVATYTPWRPVNAIAAPSGDQLGSRRSAVISLVGVATSVRTGPPAVGMARMPPPSPVVDANASVVPSGDQE